MKEVELKLARAVRERRREDGFTADVKAYAVDQYMASGDPVQAASATEQHFASQHRVFLLPPSLVVRWAGAGDGDASRFKENARGERSKIRISGFVLLCSAWCPHSVVAIGTPSWAARALRARGFL